VIFEIMGVRYNGRERYNVLPTYRAVLKGNTLEWTDEAPQDGKGKEVFVTVVGGANKVKKSRGPEMAEALRQFAESGQPSSFGDALEWQRETRQDRVLPGREE